MVRRAVRCGGCSTSVLCHLLSSEKEHGRCRLPSRPNLSMSPCAVVDVSCMAWPWTRRGSPLWSAIHRLRSDGAQGEMFGFPRLQALVSEHGKEERSLEEALLEELYSFVGEGWEQEDDITLLTLRCSSALS